MFYKYENNEIIVHPESPVEFGASSGILPTDEEIVKFSGYIWFETEQDANTFFGIEDVL